MIEYKCKDFYDKMQSLFIGYKMEGKGGFINLMDIRSRYYSKFSTFIQDDIDNIIKLYPDFIDDVFDKLYSFFSMYFSKNGSICFNNSQSNILCKYDKYIMLVWRSQMSYYVKTDCIFRSMLVDIDGHKIFFDVSNIEYKKANEKRYLSYKFGGIKDDGTIVFNVLFTETEMLDGDIISELKKHNVIINDDIIKRAIKKFKRQKYYDFFINKNTKVFLQEQFNIWWAQYFYNHKEILDINRLNQLYIFKDIAYKIIDFISQFEDELVKIWNKPKFVYNSNYVITLDRINNLNLIKKIINHQNIDWQINEWQELGIVDDSFNINNIIENDLLGEHLNKKYEHLLIDTKYFKEIEYDILSIFDDIDEELNGILIKSENYQALNLLKNKYEEKVKCIYIDPPYNTRNDGFLYKDKYMHSTWLSMMNDRLSLARDLLSDDGVIFISIDDNEQANLKLLCDEVFGEENFVQNFMWLHGKGKKDKNTRTLQQYVLCYAFNKNKLQAWTILKGKNYKFKNTDNDPKGEWFSGSISFSEKRSNKQHLNYYSIESPSGVVWKRQWLCSFEKMQEHIKNGDIYWGNSPEFSNVPRLKIRPSDKEELIPTNIIEDVGTTRSAETELKQLFGVDKIFNYPKPIGLIQHIIKLATNKNDIILDFFAGSGTTGHAVIQLNKEYGGNRKFILVEMADYFDTIILPRIKKLAYSLDWKNGKPVIDKNNKKSQELEIDLDEQENINTNNGGIFVKYQTLEQYEDSLENIANDLKSDELLLYTEIDDYLIKYMIDWESKDSNIFLNPDNLQDPFNYKLYITKDYIQQLVGIDLIETFNYLFGLHLKKYYKKVYDDIQYVAVLGEKEGKTYVIIWRKTKNMDYNKDKDNINDILKNIPIEVNEVYVNTDAILDRSFNVIDSLFKNLMLNN